LRRLQKRARGEELDIDISYLTLLHNKHEKWLMDNRIRSARCDSQHSAVADITINIAGRTIKTPILVIDCNEDVDVEDEASWRSGIQSKILHFRDHVQQQRDFHSSDC